MNNRIKYLYIIWSIFMLLTCYVFGARHDYLAYLNHWNLLLEGKNSWATNETNVGHNAYGPFHSFSAYLLIFGTLGPKFFQAILFLIANYVLLKELIKNNFFLEKNNLAFYLLAIPGNFLIIVFSFILGVNDTLVASIILFAVLLRLDEKNYFAGFLIGFAALLKYFPLFLLPFFALKKEKKLEWKVVISGLITIIVGLLFSLYMWGDGFVNSIIYGSARDPKTLSILKAISQTFNIDQLGETGKYIWDLILKYNFIFVCVSVGVVFLISLKLNLHFLVAAILGLWTVLLVYKVGHANFYLTWLMMVMSLSLIENKNKDSVLLQACCYPFMIFLSIYAWGFVFGTDGYTNESSFIRDIVGYVSFYLGFGGIIYFFLARKK